MTDTSESGSCCGIALGKKLNDKFPFQQQEGAMYALRLLSAINLLNFADRYVPAAVKSEIQDDLNLNDFQTALPNTGKGRENLLFLVVECSPICLSVHRYDYRFHDICCNIWTDG